MVNEKISIWFLQIKSAACLAFIYLFRKKWFRWFLREIYVSKQMSLELHDNFFDIITNNVHNIDILIYMWYTYTENKYIKIEI